MAKEKKKRSLSCALFISALSLVLLIALCLLLSQAELGVELSGGEGELVLEYGQDFTENVSAWVRLPLIGKIYTDSMNSGPYDTGSTGSYEVCYSMNFLGREARMVRAFRVVDTSPPVIELKSYGDYSPQWLEGYEEEGYSAYDLHDGDLTAQVAVKYQDGIAEYRVSDSAGNETVVTRTINYVNRPSLSLHGDAAVVINARPWYTDPGCAAWDESGRDLTACVEQSGQVDSTRPGDYELCYSITNPNGDTVSAVRQIKVWGEIPGDICTPEEKTIYLTFDDGPGPYTNELLDLLAAYDARATFFVTGAYERWYDCIGRAHREGHSIGVHCFNHSYGRLYSSEENYFADFNAIEQLIYAQTGEYTQLVRFPGGSSNTASCFNYGIMSRLTASLESMGYRYFDWNVNSGDAEGAYGSAMVASNIKNGCWGKNHAVVLQHDIKQFSVRAVEDVLIWGRQNGYSFKALDITSPVVHHTINN